MARVYTIALIEKQVVYGASKKNPEGKRCIPPYTLHYTTDYIRIIKINNTVNCR